MVSCVQNMFLCKVILCVIFLKISTADSDKPSSTKRHYKSKDFDFSSEDITHTRREEHDSLIRTIETPRSTVPEPTEKNPNYLSNILEEVGNPLPQLIYRKIYDDVNKTKICWKRITYVKENKSGGRTPWREYEVVFDFPDEDNSSNVEDNDKKLVTYRVRDSETRHVEQLNFTAIESNDNFTLFVNESISCGTGRFLSKIYYEWPRSNRTRVVVNLSDHAKVAEHLEKEIPTGQDNVNGQKSNVGKSDSSPGRNILDDHQNVPGNNNSDNIKRTEQDLQSFRDRLNSTDENGDEIPSNGVARDNFRFDPVRPLELSDFVMKNIKVMNNNTNGPKDNGKTHSDEHEVYSLDDNMDLIVGASMAMKNDQPSENKGYGYQTEDTSLAPGNSYTDALATLKNSAAIDDCSPFLTTLLSGKILSSGIMTGLCNLRKNEKMVLRGNITVSKKYLDETNTEFLEPLFTIREDTEIKALQDR